MGGSVTVSLPQGARCSPCCPRWPCRRASERGGPSSLLLSISVSPAVTPQAGCRGLFWLWFFLNVLTTLIILTNTWHRACPASYIVSFNFFCLQFRSLRIKWRNFQEVLVFLFSIATQIPGKGLCGQARGLGSRKDMNSNPGSSRTDMTCPFGCCVTLGLFNLSEPQALHLENKWKRCRQQS